MIFPSPSARRPLRAAALAVVALLPLLAAGCANERLLGVNYVPEKFERDRSGGEKVAYFALNRMLDFCDIMSVNVGFGPALHAEVHVTNAMRFGMGGAYLASVGSGEAPRQFGFFARGAAEVSAGPMQAGMAHYEPYLATGSEFDESYMGLSKPSNQLYRKQRDYWSVGFSFGFLLVGAQVEFHPVQLVDFMAGWFMMDPLQDDK